MLTTSDITTGTDINAVNDDELSLRKLLISLDGQKRNIESEADAIIHELNTPPADGVEPIGLTGLLVDADGYPRNDIDVYRARSIRNRFRILQTDHKEISERIGGLLVQLAAKKKDTSKEKAEAVENALRLAPKPKPKFDSVTGKWVVQNWDGSVAGVKDGDRIRFDDLSKNRNKNAISGGVDGESKSSHIISRPFAKIDGVSNQSPATDAGIVVGDLISSFGFLHANNHHRLSAVAKLVLKIADEKRSIQITVLRRRRNEEGNISTNTSLPMDVLLESNYDNEKISKYWEEVMLTLQPRPFSGRGLLGCHIVPF